MPTEDKRKTCANCMNQMKLMKHPLNNDFGKGRITEQLGWVCTMQFGDKSNKGESYYQQHKHGMCELHFLRE